jgi:hypothetical protein
MINFPDLGPTSSVKEGMSVRIRKHSESTYALQDGKTILAGENR